MINVFCLWVGNKYSIDYVTKLHNGVKANLSAEHQFICLTDKPNLHKIEGIKFIAAPITIPDSWCKLSLFTPQIGKKFEGTAFYLDLDVVITGKLDVLLKNAKMDKLNTIKDWWREGINSSVMIWDLKNFWKLYTSFKPSCMRELKGDQDLINLKMDESEIRHFGEVEIQSYKANNLQESFNKHTKIVVFHGKPKPHEVDGWVKDYWK
jgi:hypothetical protein